MTVLQQTRDVEEEPIAICHMRELKGARNFFSAAAGAQIVRAAGISAATNVSRKVR